MRSYRSRWQNTAAGRSRGSYPLLQFFTWATISCFSPYVAIVLTERGLDNSRIGLILTANALVSIIAQPVWGLVSDRVRSIRPVFMVCLAGASAVILLIPAAQSFAQLAIFYPLVLFFLSPIAPLLDVWTYQGVRLQPGTSYGALRLWGSLGFAFFVVLLGRLVSLAGLNMTSYSFALLGICSILISLKLPGAAQAKEGPGMMRAKSPLKATLLLRQYPYVSYLAVLFLAFISIQPMFAFQARLMLEVGGTQELFMWTMALAALSEIPVFISSKRLIIRFSPVSLVIASFVVFILRMLVYSVVTAPWQLVLVGLAHGISFALFLVATVSHVDNLAPQGLKSTALTLASAVYMGLSGVVGNALAGRLMDRFGIRPVYFFGALLTTAALMLFILTLLPGRRVRRRSDNRIR